MNGHPDMHDWEDQVQALLDGELDDAQASALRDAAGGDPALAQAIVEAYRLKQALAQLPMERAPASLQRKLRRIPREHGEQWFAPLLQPRWVATAAVLGVAAIGVSQLGPREPSAAEIAQAQQELAVAFAYLDRVGQRAGLEIRSTVGDEMNRAVTAPAVKAINEQFDFDKEQGA